MVTILIVLNTVVLAMDTYDKSIERENFVKSFNIVITWVFFVEMVFKLIGLGPKLYLRDVYNVFDAIVVVLSLIDYALDEVSARTDLASLSPRFQGIFTACRVIRVVRAIKLARRWSAIQDILHKMYLSLEGVSNFAMLLILFIFVIALLGMQLFDNQCFKDLDGNAVPIEELKERRETEILIPLRASFDTLWQAMNTVYISIIGDGWNWVMYDHVLPFGS